jgi:hypothetical protein
VTLAMIHPYTGALILCAAYDGLQHACEDYDFTVAVDDCDLCGGPVPVCVYCKSVVGCCDCGAYHALECPWPL